MKKYSEVSWEQRKAFTDYLKFLSPKDAQEDLKQLFIDMMDWHNQEGGIEELYQDLYSVSKKRLEDKKELIYLAIPFSHPDLAVREFRYKEANRISSILMKKGIPVYSPISHGYPIALEGGLPTSWEFWEKYLRVMLPACKAVYVLMLDGWKESIGVNAEITIAKELGIPVEYKDPNEKG